MSCELTRTALEAPLCDRTDPVTHVAIARHAERCSSCATALAEHQALLTLREQLPAALTPPRPLWAGIEARIQPRPRVWRRMAAIGLMAASLAGILLMSSGPTTRDASSPPGSFSADVEAYRSAAEELEQAVRNGRIRVSAAAVQAIEVQLARIDDASVEASAALSRDPQDPALQLAYRATVRHRLALLRQVAHLEGTE